MALLNTIVKGWVRLQAGKKQYITIAPKTYADCVYFDDGTTLNSNLQEPMIVDSAWIYVDGVSITSGNAVEKTFNAPTITGYQPIALNNYKIDNGSGGKGCSGCYLYNKTFIDGIGTLNVRNCGSSTCVVRIMVNFLYIKTF